MGVRGRALWVAQCVGGRVVWFPRANVYAVRCACSLCGVRPAGVRCPRVSRAAAGVAVSGERVTGVGTSGVGHTVCRLFAIRCTVGHGEGFLIL